MDKEREKLIGARLRAFRETLQIPRSKFAVRIGFGSERMASYEAGRAPLRYEMFRAVTQHYHINPFWLATGVGSPKLQSPFNDEAVLDLIKPRALFTEAYDMHLAAILESLAAKERTHLDLIKNNHLRSLMDFLGDDSIPMTVREKKAEQFLPTLKKLASEVKRDLTFRKKVQKHLPTESATEFNLTNSATHSNLVAVKNQWPALKRKLQETTADTGSKSRLAKFLGVDLTRVSQWLTDAKSAREPGAEYALQMKYWVEHPECQK